MAIYHLCVKAISRSTGRSATAAAAYRAGCKIVDERTGEIHDYTRKGGVESADIVLPDGIPEWVTDRAKLWNAAELTENRKDACVAREFEVALPTELSATERRRLAMDFAKDMANREGCAVDVAIHAPSRDGDNRNHHAHILRTTRKIDASGVLSVKLDTEKAGRKRSDDLAAVRARWADMTNERLQGNGMATRVDHRTLSAQGIDRQPTTHLGPTASSYERRTGESSRKRLEFELVAAERIIRAKEIGEIERQKMAIDQAIIDLSGNLAAALRVRDLRRHAQRLHAQFKAQENVEINAKENQYGNEQRHFKQQIGFIPPPHVRDRLHYLSDGDLVLDTSGDVRALWTDVPHRLEQSEARIHYKMQRSAEGIEGVNEDVQDDENEDFNPPGY